MAKKEIRFDHIERTVTDGRGRSLRNPNWDLWNNINENITDLYASITTGGSIDSTELRQLVIDIINSLNLSSGTGDIDGGNAFDNSASNFESEVSGGNAFE